LSDAEDVVAAIIMSFRVIAFFVGLYFLLSGFADFGAIGGSDILSALSLGPLAMLKIPVGLVLILAGIEPQIIAVAIQWIITS
jgi:hypothetical protein